jgi:hypothetical protein
MATWKKVVVSGSDANLASLTLDTALTVENGGTGKTTLTDGGVLVGSGTGAITSLGQAINGQLVIGSTGADPVLATLTPGSNIEITNTAGSITIAATGLNSGTVTSVGTAGTVNGITLTGGPITTTGTVTLGGTLANIANSQLTNSSITIGSTSVALGGTAATVAGLTLTGVQASGSFSGSFQGDGSNITGIASNLAIVGETGTGTVALKTQTLTVTGGEGINTVASGQTITISGEDASSSNKGIASFASSNFTATAGDVALSQDIAIVRDLTIGRNLTVQGTASFQNTTNLDVTDRFIRMASGSTSGGDGGIAIQQTGNLDAEAFGWDSAVSRWGVTGSFDASQNLMVPDAFMSTVIQGAASDPTAVVSKYTKRGNIFAAADESIWIYS